MLLMTKGEHLILVCRLFSEGIDSYNSENQYKNCNYLFRSNWLSVAGDAALLVVGGTNIAAGLIYRGNADYLQLLKVNKDSHSIFKQR